MAPAVKPRSGGSTPHHLLLSAQADKAGSRLGRLLRGLRIPPKYSWSVCQKEAFFLTESPPGELEWAWRRMAP
ncbi:hypothetical protein SAMN00790413_02470 [Deinococcus hopiensis KR-140]|uniref:Uncharacterized protein n=1 Tax=Deinococcus hopiensis KR-140 TaxID=695939 RepID=A0A1W1VMQ2_9DEIO|nr:hypothetical protein SAMN00790413_02470 [Deinococcus hopiensis KR-140]